MENSTLSSSFKTFGSLVFSILLFYVYGLSFAQSSEKSILKSSSSPILPTLNQNYNFIYSPYTTLNDAECGQETVGNNYENGLGNLHLLEFANDFVVNPDESFNLESLIFYVLVEYGETINSVDVTFYEDSGNGPGSETTAFPSFTPSDNESVGDAFGFDVRKITLDFDEPVSFMGSSAQTIYWAGVKLDYTGESSYMGVCCYFDNLNMIYMYDSDTDSWISSLEVPAFEDSYDGVMSFVGTCVDLDECSGQPDAGQIAGGDTLEICGSTAFTLSATGTTQAAGLIYQWQKKLPEEDDWTDIEGANELSLQVSNGVSEDTEYRFKIECENNQQVDFSDVKTVTVKPANECFCIPTYSTGCSSNDRISNVTLTGESNTINNDSGCSPNAYGDYTDLTPADLAPGETYTLSVSTDYSFPSSEDVRAWIDFNGNGVFEDDEEIANTNGSGLPGSGTGDFEFSVPENTEPGEYRLRVRLVYSSSSIQPCGSASWGETEDYTVEIIQLEDCEGPVTAGTVADDFEIRSEEHTSELQSRGHLVCRLLL